MYDLLLNLHTASAHSWIRGSFLFPLSPVAGSQHPRACLLSFNQRRAALSLSLLSHPNQEAGAKTPWEDPRESLGAPDLPRIWGCGTLRAD